MYSTENKKNEKKNSQQRHFIELERNVRSTQIHPWFVSFRFVLRDVY